MIPFQPDPDWYASSWYGSPPPRWQHIRTLAQAAREALRRSWRRRMFVPARPLIERHVP